jgi:hypothetical protein
MSTIAECIGRYWIAQTLRPPDRPQRAIRVAMLKTTVWRQDVAHLESKFLALAPGIDSRDARRCRVMAETGEHLGLERVGLVVR